MNQELKDLIIQAENEEVGEELAQCDEPIECSRKHKLKMNRIFRELVQSKFLPFPEVDRGVQNRSFHRLPIEGTGSWTLTVNMKFVKTPIFQVSIFQKKFPTKK